VLVPFPRTNGNLFAAPLTRPPSCRYPHTGLSLLWTMRTLLVVALGGSCDGRVAVMVMKPSGFLP
jgi:hypothetical protein